MSKPGQRTNPTVKSVSSMNKKNLERWEIRLGVAQVVIILGVATGCMTFAFYLGFFSGKSAGYEVAMESNASSAAKLPIHGDTDSSKAAIDVTEQAVTDVYARLNEKVDKALPSEIPSEHDVPSLGSIKETAPSKDVEPVAKKESGPKEVAKVPDSKKSSELDEVWDADAPPATDKGKADVKVLGDELPAAKKGAEKEKGIDTLFDDASVIAKDNGKAKAVIKELPKSTPTVAPQPTATPKKEVKTPEPKKEEVKKEETKKEDVKKDEKKVEKKEESKVSDGAGIIRGAIPAGWFAQVAAPTKLKDADAIAAKLKKSGFQVVIETANVRGESYYRILVGPESNRKQADLLVDQLRRESYISGVPFVKMVK